MSSQSATYEELREEIADLGPYDRNEARLVRWVFTGRRLGFARSNDNRLEIFFPGPPLSASSATVHRRLRHQEWWAGGERIAASRLVLPYEDHFLAIGATVAIEMRRRGLLTRDADVQTIFREVEPLLELALRRGALPEDVVRGLLGELVVLDILLRRAAPDRLLTVLETWRGYEAESRDFAIGSAAVEVKTTLSTSSRHRVNNLLQVARDPVRDHGVTSLNIVSIGLRPTEEEQSGISLPKLVGSLLRLLGAEDPAPRNALQTDFLRRVNRYGSQVSEDGYDHDRMRNQDPYQVSYELTFRRIYNIEDEAIRVLRRADVLQYNHVCPDSLTYEMLLSDRITPDNPQNGEQCDARLALLLERTLTETVP